MQYSTSVWIQIIKAKHTPNGTVIVLFKTLCTSIVQIVHNSVSCTVVSMNHMQSGSSSTIVSPFVHHISLADRNRKYHKDDIFFYLRIYVHTSSNQGSHIRKPTVPKVMHYGQERTFPWHNNATSPEYAPIRLMLQIILHSVALWPYSTKVKNIVKSTVPVLFSSICTKDLEQRWTAPWSRIIHK